MISRGDPELVHVWSIFELRENVGSLQRRALEFLNLLDPSDSASDYYVVGGYRGQLTCSIPALEILGHLSCRTFAHTTSYFYNSLWLNICLVEMKFIL